MLPHQVQLRFDKITAINFMASFLLEHSINIYLPIFTCHMVIQVEHQTSNQEVTGSTSALGDCLHNSLRKVVHTLAPLL